MFFKKSLLATSIVFATSMLTACGGSSSNDAPAPAPTPAPAPAPAPTNSAPTAVTIDNASVDENTIGATVGTLSVSDPDTDDTHTLSVSGDNFVLEGNVLRIADSVFLDVDAEGAATTMTAEITATDAAGEAVTTNIEISINDVLDRYEFQSKIDPTRSSVVYTGQVARHTLIAELNYFINSQLQSQLDDGTLPDRAAVMAKLNSLFRTSDVEYEALQVSFKGDTTQQFITQISGSQKDLVGKIAGNDATGQHKDWNNGAFAGWGETGSTTPEGLVDILFEQLADNAQAHLDGAVRTDPNGAPINSVYINDDGTDLKQMIQKFLLMSVTYSQGTDDYFGDDTDGRGLRTSNVGPQTESSPYTRLEHQYDEGFGYFGAARNYLEYTDNEIAGKVSSEADGRLAWNGQQDTNGDGSIDLTSEYNFGQSTNAAKRDRGSRGNPNPTDMTTQAMTNFIAGRKLINDNVDTELDETQMAQLRTYVEAGVDAWERAIVATVIHYINDTRSDLADLGTDAFNYADLAKHYSEMKGFALGIQFNERSQLSDADFETLHSLMRSAPVLAGEVEAYRADLLQARDILQAAYNFDADNVANW